MINDKKNVEIIRNKMKKRRDCLSENEIINKSKVISKKLNSYIKDNRFKNILCFYPIMSEVNLLSLYDELLIKGNNLYFPITYENYIEFVKIDSMNDFHEGKYNIKEPNGEIVFDDEEALVICPGLAFDKSGNRIGYGGGYYDRFIKNHQNCTTVGVGYDFQVLDRIIPMPWDVKLDLIISD